MSGEQQKSLYYERQPYNGTCAVHTINHILQRRVFTLKSLREYVIRNHELWCAKYGTTRFMTDEGLDFTEEVMIEALGEYGLSMTQVWSVDEIDLTQEVAFVFNPEEHWYAIANINGLGWCDLNSYKTDGPRRIGDIVLYLQGELAKHARSALFKVRLEEHVLPNNDDDNNNNNSSSLSSSSSSSSSSSPPTNNNTSNHVESEASSDRTTSDEVMQPAKQESAADFHRNNKPPSPSPSSSSPLSSSSASSSSSSTSVSTLKRASTDEQIEWAIRDSAANTITTAANHDKGNHNVSNNNNSCTTSPSTASRPSGAGNLSKPSSSSS